MHMVITFQSGVKFEVGTIVNSEAIADLRSQGITGDVRVTRRNNHVEGWATTYDAEPFPAEEPEQADP